jgi:predicted unusual protein kinase regulating ubiquinone biosynthesis (AarF/ABC1/UbiB family)
MLKKGRMARIGQLGGMAAGLAGDAAGAAAHLLTEKTEAAQARLHRQMAERMFRVFGDMKGLPLKAGQMLSYLDELLPHEHREIYNEMLGRLQTHTPVMEWTDIEDIFLEEFDGCGPLELFRSFDPEPIAAASIGQVYRATLPDGREVVVKVQYPGVAEALDSDLDNVETLINATAHILPRGDMTHFVEEIMSRLREECDYEREAKNQRDFYYRWLDDGQVVVPRIVDELCRSRVLVSEFISGREWAPMLGEASPELKTEYGTVIFRFVFQSLLTHGMFNADPHPGNYLFFPDGRVAFIDYGCVQRFTAEQRTAFVNLREALLAGRRGDELRPAMEGILPLPDDLDRELVQLLEDYLYLSFQPITAPQPYRFTREYMRELLKLGMHAKMDSQQGAVAFLGRINFGLGAILARLDTEADFRALIADL